MSKHTEGPWKLRPYTKAGETEYLIDTGDGWTTAKVYATIPAEDEANARLIAAAPELYEVLRDAREAALEHRAGDVFGILLGDVCSEAVEKAEGRQS